MNEKSPTGWWVASYIERAALDNEQSPKPNSRHLAWENTIILQATDREAAFSKAVKLASSNTSAFEDKNGQTGCWVFEGLTSLVPLYEEPSDGSEISWQEHKNKTYAKLKSFVKSKEQLEAFSDTPEKL